MIDVVYHLINVFGISTKTGRLMLPKWIKISEKRFNEILCTVTEAKNNGYKTNVDGREIPLDNAESLLKGIGSGKINVSFKKSTTILMMMWKRYQISPCLQEVKMKWQKCYYC